MVIHTHPSTPRYIIATGYVRSKNSVAQYREWCENTFRWANPQRTFVLSTDNVETNTRFLIDWINLGNNLGHVHNLPKTKYLSGWSAAILTAALLAYQVEADLIYKEADCLAFGNWVATLYNDLGNASVITGKKNVGGTADGLLAQSAFLVRHSYLLRFVSLYLSLPPDTLSNLPELKFEQLAKDHPANWATTTMGYDRTRPANFLDKAFYLQHVTQDERKKLQDLALL